MTTSVRQTKAKNKLISKLTPSSFILNFITTHYNFFAINPIEIMKARPDPKVFSMEKDVDYTPAPTIISTKNEQKPNISTGSKQTAKEKKRDCLKITKAKVTKREDLKNELLKQRSEIRTQLKVPSYADNWPYVNPLSAKLRGQLLHKLRLIDQALLRMQPRQKG